jgi:Mrp family chromosome partitioning ATPase
MEQYKVKNILLIISGKGGVGKSTTSTLLATTFTRRGCKVGLLDCDLCGPSIPYLLGLESKGVCSTQKGGWLPVVPDDPNFKNISVMSLALLLKSRDDAVAWRGPKKSTMIKQFLSQVIWGDLDYLIIDTPPGTSDEHLTLVEYIQANFKQSNFSAVLVTTPQCVSLIDVQKEIAFCQNVGLKIEGIFENMSGFVCPTCSECTQIFGSGGGKSLCDMQNLPYLGSLPIDPRLSNYMASGMSFFEVYLNHLEQGESIGAIKSYVASKIQGGENAIEIDKPVSRLKELKIS